jgi:hypothetical protein
MVGLINQYLKEEHREAQGGPLVDEVGAWNSAWIALECGCRAKLVFEAQSADRASRHLQECGVCRKSFARSSVY